MREDIRLWNGLLIGGIWSYFNTQSIYVGCRFQTPHHFLRLKLWRSRRYETKYFCHGFSHIIFSIFRLPELLSVLLPNADSLSSVELMYLLQLLPLLLEPLLDFFERDHYSHFDYSLAK